MIDPEPICEALLDRVSEVAPVEFATRYKLGTEQLPQFPACIVGLEGANIRREHGRPATWTLSFDVGFIDRADGSSEAPETRLNEWLVNLQVAMEPDEGEKVLTLGGLVDHAWIVGSVDYVPPSLEFPWMQCWVQVEVLVVG